MYFEELSKKPEVIRLLLDLVREKQVVTLRFAALEKERNGAVALKMYPNTRDQ